MGKGNVVTKEYMQNNVVFADACNYFIYGGQQVIRPEQLHEMDPAIQKYVADYQINLIEPAAMEKEDLAKFQSDLGSVLGFIKYSKDEEALNSFLSNEPSLKRLDREAAQVISVCTNTKIEIDDEEEAVDVCKAVDQMTERARLEGRLETLRNAVKNAMKAFHVSMEDAMNGLEVPQEDRDLIIKML